MKRYIKFYNILLVLNWKRLMMYPANFINNLFAALAWGGFTAFSIWILTWRIQSVFGWTRDELMVLIGFYTFSMGIFHAFFTRNFEQLSRISNQGSLDMFLLKPIDSQFHVTFWTINFAALSRVIFGIFFTIYFYLKLNLNFDAMDLLWSIIFVVLGIFLLYSLWMIGITFTIWFTRLSNLVDLMFTISGIARFPREMFQNASPYALILVLPMTFVMSTPVKILLHKATVIDIFGSLTLALLFFVISRRFWVFSLKFYTSASS